MSFYRDFVSITSVIFYRKNLRIFIPFTDVIGIRILKLEKVREVLELVLLSSLSFLIPLFIGHPQIVVGVVVNAIIVRCALTMKGWKNLPTILFPYLGAVTRGIMFGPFTVYLVYLVPFIWFGNFVLAFFIKLFSKAQFRYSSAITIIISSALKVSTIFLPTLLLVNFSIIPNVFLKPMGIVQFFTAVIGSSIALVSTKLELKYLSTDNKHE